jgi:pyruvate/2-oxoglutarate dehydrogenase complex dihydrolipoamide dehydrogenase (E3) component
MPDYEVYDAIVIGAGQGGLPLTTTLAGKGWKIALIERKFVGGTCINYGCTPTKTMVASAQAAYLAQRSHELGVHAHEVRVDMEKIRQRKREMVESFRQGNQRRIDSSGAELIRGSASFTGPKTVKVMLNQGGVRSLTAEKIFIDTGARPSLPEISGIQQVHWLDSTTIMELDRVPDHLMIIGGGYIGVEFGQMFRRFGSRVTIIQRDQQLLSIEDPDIAGEVGNILQEEGVEILFNSRPTKAVEVMPGEIRLTVEDDHKLTESTIVGSHLLVAAGRTPNIEDLNLTAAGIASHPNGTIKVNERLETNVEGVYALGDVKGGPAFTHISYDDFRILRTNLLEGGHATIYDRPVPYVVFIDPQLGRIGLTEKQAKTQGLEYRVAKMPMDYVARALELGQSRGMMKALVDAKTDQVLGCAILGVEGGEIMAMIEVAMMAGLPYPRLRDGVFSHPTLAESLNTLFSMLE